MSTSHTTVDDRHVWMNLVKVIGALVAIAFGLIAAVAAIT